MDINQLIYFGEICRAGSLSKAAEALHISQQGLSLSIKRLESELGCSLFNRKPNGLELTEIGRQVRAESDAAIDHINRIYQYCQASKEDHSRVTVACTTGMVTRMPNALRNMLLRGTEDYDVRFIEDWTSACEDLVYNNQANFGIVYGPCDEEKFQVKTLDIFQQVLVVSRKSPLAACDDISLEELAGRPLILPSEQCRPGKTIRALFEKAGITPNIVYTSDRSRQILDMVTSDPDVCARIISDDVTPSDMPNVSTLTLRDDPFLLPVCLIYKKGQKLTLQERFFAHLVTDSFAEDI